MPELSESEVIRKGPCPDCGSSDACALYTDGHTHCFSCKAHHHGDGESAPRRTKTAEGLIHDGDFKDLKARGISEKTCRHFGYRCGTFKGRPCQIAPYYTPDGGELVAQKIRFADKTFLMLGQPKRAGLYGQQLWRDGGKMVVVTEGEIDAMSMSEVQENRWPVVSVPSGATGAKKALQRSLDWLEKFETIVLMFDMDEPGQKAARECAELFSPGKCKLARLPLKDANEMLTAGRVRELLSAMWDAKDLRPDGVINGNELWDKIIAEDSTDAFPYPWEGLQRITRGCRRGEIVTFTAGSGVGKSQICRQIAWSFLREHGDTVGYVALEESVKKTGLHMMGLELGQRIHLDRSGVSDEKMRAAFDATVGSGRMFLYDHWGSTDSSNLLSKIRYLVRGCGCSTIVLDHLSIVVSGQEDGDERRIIDNTMTSLRTLVEELQCRMLLVSHLKRPEGKGHEDGARTSLSQLRGSAAIGQLSDLVVGLERDQQAKDGSKITCVRVLKNRFSGETGEACYLIYDEETGRLIETMPPDTSSPDTTGDEKEDAPF